MSKRKPPTRTSSIEVHPLKGKREGALLNEQIWFEGETIVAYSLAYINLRLCRVDHGRVLGFDNSHDFQHRHFMGRVEAVEYTSYDAILARFISEVHELWRLEDEN